MFQHARKRLSAQFKGSHTKAQHSHLLLACAGRKGVPAQGFPLKPFDCKGKNSSLIDKGSALPGLIFKPETKALSQRARKGQSTTALIEAINACYVRCLDDVAAI